jgi:hypothetical protein
MNLRLSYSWCLNCKSECICQQFERERERKRKREWWGGEGPGWRWERKAMLRMDDKYVSFQITYNEAIHIFSLKIVLTPLI